MPWNEVKPMDQRVLFIADHLRDRYSFGELCSRYGISRKTGYKWLGRYRRDGVEGLEERSRRPHHCATAYPFAVRQAVIELRTDGGDVLGPKKIQALLARRYP
ncbi:helix-turn-helix domain-containing protein, partial [Denitromonas iodatirespirans]